MISISDRVCRASSVSRTTSAPCPRSTASSRGGSPFSGEAACPAVGEGAAAAAGWGAGLSWQIRMYSSPPSSSPFSTRKAATALRMAGWLGFTMGQSSPAIRAWDRKERVMFSRSGMPKEMLLTPRVVCTPSRCFTASRAFRVSWAWACWADTVRVRQSIYRSERGMPYRSAASAIRAAMFSRSCQVSGMPFSSRHSPTTAAPYFLHRGRMASSTSCRPLTEFTRALPQQARSPASTAAGSAESICRGRSTAACTARITCTIFSFSSTPGRPTLISRISAPASCCWMARETI